MSVTPDAVNYVRKGMRTGGILGALGGGALGAAAGIIPKTYKDPETGKQKDRTTKQKVVGGILGAGAGAYGGHGLGHAIGGIHHAYKWVNGFRPAVARPDWLKNVKTKAEGRRAYHAMSRQHHPDMGGNPHKFNELVQEWKTHEPMLKEAMLSAFADELLKIGNVGTYMGGALGYKLSPGSLKGKLVGTAAGALVGTGIGGAAGALKRGVWDEQRAREHEALYGYTPVAGQQAGAPTNFY